MLKNGRNPLIAVLSITPRSEVVSVTGRQIEVNGRVMGDLAEEYQTHQFPPSIAGLVLQTSDGRSIQIHQQPLRVDRMVPRNDFYLRSVVPFLTGGTYQDLQRPANSKPGMSSSTRSTPSSGLLLRMVGKS